LKIANGKVKQMKTEELVLDTMAIEIYNQTFDNEGLMKKIDRFATSP